MSTLDPSELGTVLGVWAHPDDETYLSAGIMALAADAGSRVVCVTATRGEAGVEEHLWLDYPDGGCAAVAVDEGTGRVLASWRRCGLRRARSSR